MTFPSKFISIRFIFYFIEGCPIINSGVLFVVKKSIQTCWCFIECHDRFVTLPRAE